MEPTSDKKGIYQLSLIVALLFGGPFVTGWFVSENLKEFGEYKKSKKNKTIGIISGLLFISLPTLFFLLTQEVFGEPASIGILSFVFSYGLIASQGTSVKECFAQGGKERKDWPAICIIFTILNLFLVVLPMVLSFI